MQDKTSQSIHQSPQKRFKQPQQSTSSLHHVSFHDNQIDQQQLDNDFEVMEDIFMYNINNSDFEDFYDFPLLINNQHEPMDQNFILNKTPTQYKNETFYENQEKQNNDLQTITMKRIIKRNQRELQLNHQRSIAKLHQDQFRIAHMNNNSNKKSSVKLRYSIDQTLKSIGSLQNLESQVDFKNQRKSADIKSIKSMVENGVLISKSFADRSQNLSQSKDHYYGEVKTTQVSPENPLKLYKYSNPRMLSSQIPSQKSLLPQSLDRNSQNISKNDLNLQNQSINKPNLLSINKNEYEKNINSFTQKNASLNRILSNNNNDSTLLGSYDLLQKQQRGSQKIYKLNYDRIRMLYNDIRSSMGANEGSTSSQQDNRSITNLNSRKNLIGIDNQQKLRDSINYSAARSLEREQLISDDVQKIYSHKNVQEVFDGYMNSQTNPKTANYYQNLNQTYEKQQNLYPYSQNYQHQNIQKANHKRMKSHLNAKNITQVLLDNSISFKEKERLIFGTNNINKLRQGELQEPPQLQDDGKVSFRYQNGINSELSTRKNILESNRNSTIHQTFGLNTITNNTNNKHAQSSLKANPNIISDEQKLKSITKIVQLKSNSKNLTPLRYQSKKRMSQQSEFTNYKATLDQRQIKLPLLAAAQQ